MTTLQEVDKRLSGALLRQGQSSHTTRSPLGDDALLRSLAPNSTSAETEHCHMLTHILYFIVLLKWFAHRMTNTLRSTHGLHSKKCQPTTEFMSTDGDRRAENRDYSCFF